MEDYKTRENGHTAIYKQMKKNGIIKRLMFTLCLGHNGGYLQFGGYSKRGFSEEPKWFTIVDNNDFKIGVKRMTLDGKSITENIVGFVDSGTNVAYLPEKVYKKV
jgi:hypothetical protein